jgi:hypothetical protein
VPEFRLYDLPLEKFNLAAPLLWEMRKIFWNPLTVSAH